MVKNYKSFGTEPFPHTSSKKQKEGKRNAILDSTILYHIMPCRSLTTHTYTTQWAPHFCTHTIHIYKKKKLYDFMTLTAWEQCQTDADVITFFFLALLSVWTISARRKCHAAEKKELLMPITICKQHPQKKFLFHHHHIIHNSVASVTQCILHPQQVYLL